MKKIAFPAAFAVAAAACALATAPLAVPASAQEAQPAPAAHQQPMAKKPMAKKHMAKRHPSKAVMTLQEALNKHGAQLKVDGLMGPATRVAIKKFQAQNGLKATGRADKATRGKLGA